MKEHPEARELYHASPAKALTKACSRGYLKVAQKLAKRFELSYEDIVTNFSFFTADSNAKMTSFPAFLLTIKHDHLDVLRWLVDRFVDQEEKDAVPHRKRRVVLGHNGSHRKMYKHSRPQGYTLLATERLYQRWLRGSLHLSTNGNFAMVDRSISLRSRTAPA